MTLLCILLFSLLTSQEIERRTAIDFNKRIEDILPYIQKYYPNVDSTQIDLWEKSKALEYKIIDGEKRYFKNAAPNLFRIDKEARERKINLEGKEKAGREIVIKNHVKDILETAKTNQKANNLYLPHNWSFYYSINIRKNAKLKDNEKIRIWLPAPNTNVARQTNVKIIYSNQRVKFSTDGMHASAYMEQIYHPDKQCRSEIKYTFTTRAEYHQLPKDFPHKKADINDKDLKPYLKERTPHCIFSDKIRHLADDIVGAETRQYYQARKLFKAIRKIYPWASAREYSTIDNIPEYVIDNKHGDCGQVTLLYIAMCRYKGIPARWQSGFMLHPGYENLHDWCEIYIEGMGWIPVDPSFGVQEWGVTEEERYFYFGGIDAYRLIVNTDWGSKLYPNKKYERSETVDFQRGECESQDENLYFDQWKYHFEVKKL